MGVAMYLGRGIASTVIYNSDMDGVLEMMHLYDFVLSNNNYSYGRCGVRMKGDWNRNYNYMTGQLDLVECEECKKHGNNN